MHASSRALLLLVLTLLLLSGGCPASPPTPLPTATSAPPTANATRPPAATATPKPSQTAMATATRRPTATVTPAPVAYRIWVPKLYVYDAPDATASSGYILRGRTFTILSEEGGWAQIGGPNGEVPPESHWIQVSSTAYAPVDAPPQMVASGAVYAYSQPDGERTASLGSGTVFCVLEVRDNWLRVRATTPSSPESWITVDAPFYPEGEPTPTPTPLPWPRQIGDLEADGFAIYNLSTRLGAVGAPWGSRDTNGELCPDGGANMPCEGKVIYNSGMEEDNIAYVAKMFARYSEGRTLAIYIRDDAPPNVPLTYDGPYYQQYGTMNGGAMQLHIVFKDAFFGLDGQKKHNFSGLMVDGKLWSFLATYQFLDRTQFENSLLGNVSSGVYAFPVPDPAARELTGLSAPAKIILEF